MKNKVLTGLASWWAILSITCSFAGNPAVVGAEVKFKVLRNSVIVVPVTINGRGKFPFVLDTGSDTTFVEPDLAKELGLQPVDRLVAFTAVGKRAVPRAWLESVAVGPHNTENVEVLVADMPAIRELRAGIRGTLGLNFLARFNYLIDFRRKRIQFETGEESAARLQGSRVYFEPSHGLIEIDAHSSPSRNTALRLKLDSGATGLVLFTLPPCSSDFVLEPDAIPLEAHTNSGRQTAQQVRLRRLQIGDVTFTSLPAALLLPDRDTADTRVGLLPLSIFRSVYINHRQHYVIFNPQTQ